ncbi:response regulator [Asticcacaulis sp. YBE204]|uniref:response regulator n=1 Tax=Asticcacaulis sp. YBE204 TaxID=1282363 RepID=UPI0003C3C14D|nr:response regulator [Asticcacaulis sp. YBE204]ESQ78739.1 hypothetical protein AEYBE204_12195 [Asticcacaulis sp. YBE204]
MSSLNGASKRLLRILVVEDEPDLRALALMVLEEDGGFDVLMAESADAAFAILASDDAIDCVFTDVNMPGLFDGLDLAAGIMKHFHLTKVVITSGNGYVSTPVPGVPFVPKPYNVTNLPDILRSAVAS